MSEKRPGLDDYHEYYDDGDLSHITVTTAGEHSVTCKVSATGRESLSLSNISPEDGVADLPRPAFAHVAFAVHTLGQRGFDVDLGPLSGLGMGDSVSERFDAAARETVPEAGGVPEASTDGGTVVESASTPDAPAPTPTPTPRTLTEELEPAIRPRHDPHDEADLRALYAARETMADVARAFPNEPYDAIRHRLIQMGIHDPRPPAKQADLPAWVSDYPDRVCEQMVPADSGVTVETVCAWVEQFETLTLIHRQTPWGEWQRTVRLFGALGLAGTDARLYGDAAERCEELLEILDDLGGEDDE